MPLALLAAPGKPQPGNPFPSPWPPTPSAPSHRQHATCPTCGRAVAGLLAGCDQAACLTADLDFDAVFIRWEDR